MLEHPHRDADRRIVALDGLRGLMTILVVVSHYFAELPGGLRLGLGWVAVDVFFVLSGFLVGRLILDKGHHANFLRVFYARRVLRTFPIYFACVIPLALSAGGTARPVPGWAYLTFVQNLFMAARDTVGPDWLAPTWTLAVEEQFYLLVPVLMLATPRRLLLPVLAAGWAAAVAARLAFASGGHEVAALALLPSRADGLIAGLIAALALRTPTWAPTWARTWTSLPCRAAPVAALLAGVAISAAAGTSGAPFIVAAHAILPAGAALFILSLVGGAPEARRFDGRVLRFFGRTSYAVYLTHVPILWGGHLLLCHASPRLAGAGSWLVTLLCLPVCVGVAWALTRFVEEPITAVGRRIGWSDARPAPPSLSLAGP